MSNEDQDRDRDQDGTRGERVGFWLYLITDGHSETRSGSVPSQLEGRLTMALSAVPRGSAAVQLRTRGLDGAALLTLAEKLRHLTSRLGAKLLINDRLDVAMIVGADGVHLPAHGLPPRAARRLLGDRVVIGSSTHSLVEAQAAVDAGADFVTYGPIWPTPSKPQLDPAAFPPLPGGLVYPVGVEGLEDAVAGLSVPVFALGGVDSVERARLCIAAGARIACLRAVLQSDHPGTAARGMLEAAGLAQSGQGGDGQPAV